MRLDRIKIQNIRSIKNLEIEFPSSTLLFYGDIGCGKSSVLKAIEFALFGTLNAAELKGESLLRRSENKASVELAFTVDDSQYIIKRGLSRSTKGTISQPKGSLWVDEVETSYSVTDLRRKILEILNYSITRYEKAQKIPIYRYTVYTPQESVKEILQADPNDRFEILKDVFGIEKYEIALKNIDVINVFIRDKIKEYRGRLKEIGDPEENIPIKEEELTQQEKKIKNLENQIRDKEVETKNAKEKVVETEKLRDILSKQLIEIQNKEKNVSDDSKTLDDSERKLDVAQKGMITYEKELKKTPEISIDFEENKEELNKAIKDKRNDISKKEKQVGIFEKAKENREKLLKEGKCSLCGQEIHDEDRFKKELKEVNKSIETLTTDIDECEKEIQGLEKKKEDLAEYSQNKAKREMYEKLIEGEKKREKELKIQIEELNEKIEQERDEISETLKKQGIEDLEKLKQVEKQTKEDLKGLQTVLEKKQSELNELKVEISAENKSLEYIKKELEGLKQLIKKKESLTQKIESFTVLRDWIKDKLPVLIRDIEREILCGNSLSP